MQRTPPLRPWRGSRSPAEPPAEPPSAPARGPAALARVLGAAGPDPDPPPAPAVAWVDGPIADLLPLPRPAVPAAAVVLTLLVTLAMLMFVLTEPERRWIAFAGAASAAFGADGMLRRARAETFALGVSTVPQLILPALYALALPLFVEHNARGLWTLPAVLAAGLGFGAILVAEARSVREFEAGFAPARIVAGAGAYLTAFAVLSLSWTFGLALAPAVAAAAAAGGLLSVELLRDAALDHLDLLTFAAVAAFVLGQLRWALHFVPFDGHLAALTLTLALFFACSVLYAHLRRQLTRAALLEYGGVAAAGVALAVAARAADLA